MAKNGKGTGKGSADASASTTINGAASAAAVKPNYTDEYGFGTLKSVKDGAPFGEGRAQTALGIIAEYATGAGKGSFNAAELRAAIAAKDSKELSAHMRASMGAFAKGSASVRIYNRLMDFHGWRARVSGGNGTTRVGGKRQSDEAVSVVIAKVHQNRITRFPAEYPVTPEYVKLLTLADTARAAYLESITNVNAEARKMLAAFAADKPSAKKDAQAFIDAASNRRDGMLDADAPDTLPTWVKAASRASEKTPLTDAAIAAARTLIAESEGKLQWLADALDAMLAYAQTKAIAAS